MRQEVINDIIKFFEVISIVTVNGNSQFKWKVTHLWPDPKIVFIIDEVSDIQIAR